MIDLTADELEALVRKAQRAGDAEGVQSGLVALAVSNPARAATLLDTLKIHLDLDLGAAADRDR
jgi:hypothetical protein